MTRALFCLALFVCFRVATAETAVVVSPDMARTYSYGHVISHPLHWDERAQMLTAAITFSNLSYVSDNERRVDESFTFTFPGVRFDSQMRTFHARTAGGRRVPVAALRRELCGDSVQPLPGTRFHVLKKSGRAHVVLVADADAAFGHHWVYHNDGFLLQNLFHRPVK